MSRAETITTTTIDRWLMPHIAGILAYADRNPAFGVTLATWLDEENWSITPVPNVTPSQHVTPIDQEHADDIIDWLMHELVTHPEARIARSLMVTWTSDYEVSQDLICGLTRTDSFGPTSTHMPTKKKVRSQLQIVIDETWQSELAAEQLTEETFSLTQNLIALELRKAGGKVGSLHPDTAEWCMGGAATKLFTVSDKRVRDVYETALAEDLHHTPLNIDGNVVAVAISPSVNDALVTTAVE